MDQLCKIKLKYLTLKWLTEFLENAVAFSRLYDKIQNVATIAGISKRT